MRILWGLGASLLLVAGCAAPPEPGRGDGVVLLADWRQGLLPASAMYDPPDFVLYGDGRAVVREDPDSDVLELVEYRLTPERVRALFEDAADAELFDDQDYSLDAQVLDGGSLVIMLRTTEREHLVRVAVPDSADSGARGEAAGFAESLQPSGWAAEDFSGPPKPYRPDRVAVVYGATTGDGVPRAWPLPEAEPSQQGCVVLTGAVAERAQELGETAPRETPWRHGDTTFRAWVRPLLPDEADCAAIEMRYLD